MTIPVEPPPPPETIGTQPRNAAEVNALIGMHLKGFLASRATVGQDAKFLAVTDLKAAPYFYSPSQEALIKSAVTDLDNNLDGIDTTFIDQIVGMF